MKVNNTVCKKCDGWGEIEKENKLLPCNNCDGDYFYNFNGVPINQRDRGYQLNNGWKHDRT
jgi:DnaJ-class molecular chaperone